MAKRRCKKPEDGVSSVTLTSAPGEIFPERQEAVSGMTAEGTKESLTQILSESALSGVLPVETLPSEPLAKADSPLQIQDRNYPQIVARIPHVGKAGLFFGLPGSLNMKSLLFFSGKQRTKTRCLVLTGTACVILIAAGLYAFSRYTVSAGPDQVTSQIVLNEENQKKKDSFLNNGTEYRSDAFSAPVVFSGGEKDVLSSGQADLPGIAPDNFAMGNTSGNTVPGNFTSGNNIPGNNTPGNIGFISVAPSSFEPAVSESPVVSFGMPVTSQTPVSAGQNPSDSALNTIPSTKETPQQSIAPQEQVTGYPNWNNLTYNNIPAGPTTENTPETVSGTSPLSPGPALIASPATVTQSVADVNNGGKPADIRLVSGQNETLSNAEFSNASAVRPTGKNQDYHYPTSYYQSNHPMTANVPANTGSPVNESPVAFGSGQFSSGQNPAEQNLAGQNPTGQPVATFGQQGPPMPVQQPLTSYSNSAGPIAFGSVNGTQTAGYPVSEQTIYSSPLNAVSSAPLSGTVLPPGAGMPPASIPMQTVSKNTPEPGAGGFRGYSIDTTGASPTNYSLSEQGYETLKTRW